MSYDRIWIEYSERQGGWFERSEAERKNFGDKFKGHFDRLYAQGHFVVLVAGGNCCFDELFVFQAEADALKFYEDGYRKWEMSRGDENYGFQEVSLYLCGRRIASKSCAPSERIEANHYEAEFEKAAEFMEREEGNRTEVNRG